jgi:superfamily II DNA/RNA helicase
MTSTAPERMDDERVAGEAGDPGTLAKTFADLGVEARLVAELERHGIVEPFPIQAATIPDALAGRDLCGQARTGSGKTLAFGVPLLQCCGAGAPGRPVAVVLVPTRELALQVTAVLRPLARVLGRKVVTIYGGAGLDAQVRRMAQGVDVVVATPGRLIDLVSRKEVSLGGVEALVIDEADRMADLGFLPQVEWLLRHMTGRRQTMLFSATLEGETGSLARRFLSDPIVHQLVEGSPTVAAMTHRFLQVHEMDKAKVAAAIARASARTLMFVRTKRAADRLVRTLVDEGVRATAIHGDLRQSERERSMTRFASGDATVLVATDVAARGIDVEGIDVVVHYDPPEDHKSYLHRSGRTARAGAGGVSVTLVLWDQVVALDVLRRRLGIDEPLVEVFSNDPRLADLVAFGSST